MTAPVDPASRTRRSRRRLGRRFQLLCQRWGVSIVEVAFALPIFILVLLGAMQAGGLAAVHKHMQSVADEVAAEIAAGSLALKAAETVAHERLAGLGLDYVVEVLAVADTPRSGRTPTRRARVLIELPAAELAGIDLLGLHRGRVLSASADLLVP